MNADEAYVVLELVRDFLDDQSDVVDGPYGEPQANKAMQLKARVEEILTWLEKF